jgi:hypothetical protein
MLVLGTFPSLTPEFMLNDDSGKVVDARDDPKLNKTYLILGVTPIIMPFLVCFEF